MVIAYSNIIVQKMNWFIFKTKRIYNNNGKILKGYLVASCEKDYNLISLCTWYFETL